MKIVLFVNDSTPNCGVRSYGFRVAQIFKASRKWNVVYVERGSSVEFLELVCGLNPQVVIYNYLPQTMPWLTHPIINSVRSAGCKQGLIVHNIGYAEIFDFYLHQNPSYPESRNNFPLLRPLFDWDFPTGNIGCLEGEPPTIGTFGFALPEKDYPRICQLVNEQFDEANIDMHLTAAHFRPDQGWLAQIKSGCERAITKPGITLRIYSEFVDDEAILDFLSHCDLNVFLYQTFPHYNGLSSVIDYALSVRKPIAVCRSGLFAHISDALPSICVEDRTLPEIMRDGFAPLQGLAEAWSNANFVSHLEGILDSL